MACLFPLTVLALCTLGAQDGAPQSSDRFRIAIPAGVATTAPVSGRLIVFLVEARARFEHAEPLDAPFLRKPQPIVSIRVEDLSSVDFVELGDDVPGTSSFPSRLDDLNGEFRLRAVFDSGRQRSHNAPGNPRSGIERISAVRGESQTFELTLDGVIEETPLPERDNLRWVNLKSEVLSATNRKPIFHRAGVVLPPEYDEPLAARRFWPTIYVIPGFGGDHRAAVEFASILADPMALSIVPQAVWVFLDPNAPLGHHGFVNSENNGPRASALVDEFIPWLEKRFRLEARTTSRIVTGHSSGGWSSLWLQLNHPDVFGACFSSAPDPVSFAQFGMVNLYRDRHLYTTNDGESQPSMRRWLSPELAHVNLTVAEELAMERAIAPGGTSGEQWDAWNAMFSPIDRATGLPQRAWNPDTGALDAFIIEAGWVPHDIALLTLENWDRVMPIFRDRIRLVCGSHDSFYLERAVKHLKGIVDSRQTAEGDGYIEIIDGADHATIVPQTRQRWFGEMRSFLEANSIRR
jgi:hypothetical protein